jgi:hypothetical protein
MIEFDKGRPTEKTIPFVLKSEMPNPKGLELWGKSTAR